MLSKCFHPLHCSAQILGNEGKGRLDVRWPQHLRETEGSDWPSAFTLLHEPPCPLCSMPEFNVPSQAALPFAKQVIEGCAHPSEGY